MQTIRLGSLGLGVRLGLTGVMLVTGLGEYAGTRHFIEHYNKRDDRPGLTVDDLKGAYHGIDTPSMLMSSLERGHPPTLTESERKTLRSWLASGKIEGDYDNPDLGDASPKEIIASSCLSCHSARVDNGKLGGGLVLDTPADIKKVAFAKKVLPTPIDKVMVSLHAHGPTMGMMALLVIGACVMSRWNRCLVGWLSAACGLGLVVALSGWLVTRWAEGYVYVMLAGGTLFHATFAVLWVLGTAELWLPGGKRGGCCGGGCACQTKG